MKTKYPCLFNIVLALCFVFMLGFVSDTNACDNSNQALFAGSTDVMSFNDFKDMKGYEKYRKEIEWYLHSGITNGGQTWDTFEPGEAVQRWEWIHNMYRYYAVMNETGAPFSDVGMIFSPDEDRYFVPTVSLRGAGIIWDKNGDNCIQPEDNLTVEDMLTYFYRAINSSDSATVPGTAMEPGELSDLSTYKDTDKISSYAVEGVAAMIKGRYYKPRGRYINPQGDVSRAEMIRLFYALRNTRAPKVMNPDAEARILADNYIDGGKAKFYNETLTGEQGAVNTSIIYAKNGARVDVKKCDITSYSDMDAFGSQLAYRWGLNGTLVANGVGSFINVKDSVINTTSPNSSYPNCGYAFYPVCSGTIIVKDTDVYCDQPTFELCYNGHIVFEHVNITGEGRTFTSDHFGGTVVYKNVYSNKTGGGFFIDENTTGEFYNSTLLGNDFLATITGVGKVYMKDTTINIGTGFTFTNNTSMPMDIATCTLEGGSFTVKNGDLFSVVRQQRAIIKVGKDARINLADGKNLLSVTGGSHAKMYLTDIDVKGNIFVDPVWQGMQYVNEPCTVEIYLVNSRITGDITVGEGCTAKIYLKKSKFNGSGTGDFEIIEVKSHGKHK